MEPVVGVDVAKGCSVMQAFTRRNEPYGKLQSISHGENGFERLGDLLAGLQVATGIPPVVVLEATGHYHKPLVAYLERSGWTHFIVNPLQSKRAKGTQLRKVKTDATDTWHLADMYYRGDVEAHRTWEETFTELQHVTRQHAFVTDMFVQAKLNIRALLEQVFPDYEEAFSNLFSITSLKVLKRCLEDDMENLVEVIEEDVGKSHSKRWVGEKAERIEALLSIWRKHPISRSQTAMLSSMVTLLLTFIEQLGGLERQMDRIASILPEIELLKSIPGIGDKLAAAIVAEIGDINQFEDAKQLVAYAGLDPAIYSSGKFTATSSRITKRGSKRLRRSLYLAVQCGIRKSANRRIWSYYDKKRKEGKPYKVAVIACANKLLHHIYAILSKSQPYKA
ncbi:IS110 family transposase ISHaha5 [Paenibacillus sp. CECT 9249]|uniref:IS110 family transposase n=1 Tax=Paenibacillus sp. CECT 9249 TaxID=2845385 RepID=UPI001E2DA912|nr:IS110 family transposase [Paenibacillus sp. CECT 9249]CAH0122657.1 IS110 family transposase ISHaha5 [Paenibacillus sp. CECT 9249]